MNNPFSKNGQQAYDVQLIKNILNGSQKSLDKLIQNHQRWIYNIAFKMVMDHDDASDITQEVLIKILTNLSTYNPQKASFRTWLYRIVVNHVINMKKKKFENRIYDYDRYVSLIEKLPDNRSFARPEAALLEEELKIGCMMGMVMCLNRRDRIVFILGAVFNVTDVTGAEIMDLSRDNFRKILSRSRQKVYSYMNGVCGHVNPDNPCRCSNKTEVFFNMGMIDPENTRFYQSGQMKVNDVINSKLEKFDESFYGPFLDLFRQQPFYESPDMVGWFREMLGHKEFHEIFEKH